MALKVIHYKNPRDYRMSGAYMVGDPITGKGFKECAGLAVVAGYNKQGRMTNHAMQYDDKLRTENDCHRWWKENGYKCVWLK